MPYATKEKMTTKNNDSNIDSINLCKKIEEQISIYSKKQTPESSKLVNEVLRPSFTYIKLTNAILTELSKIGSKHFT